MWFATHFVELARALSERSGVRCMHLSVDVRLVHPTTSTITNMTQMSDPQKMAMLYQLAPGTVEESGYGLALARVLPLPPTLLARAAVVAEELRRHESEKEQTSLAVLVQRRRRLILMMHEHLVQAQQSNMQGAALKTWLQDLQNEFVARMADLDEAVLRAHDSNANLGMSDTEAGGDITRDDQP